MSMTPFSFNRVVLFGASILNSLAANGRWSEYFSQEFGVTVALTNDGVSGSNAQNGRDRIDATIAAVPGGETAVFIVHLGGNDITNIWDNETNRATYVSNMTYIHNAIVTAGHKCIFCTISFRQYGTPENSHGDWTGGNSYDDPEAYGADKINVEVLIPLIASLDSSQINSDGRPYMDFHNWSYNHGPLILDTDGNHFIEYLAPQRWMSKVLYLLSTTGDSPVVSRFSDPRTHIYTPATINLNFKSYGLGPECEIEGVNDITSLRLILRDANDEVSGLVMVPPGSPSAGNNGSGTTTDRQLDYLAGAQTSSYHRVTAGAQREYVISGFVPGSLVSCSFSSSRNTNNTYITRITVNGVSLGEKNSAVAGVVQTFSGDATIDSSGELVILHESTASFGYINSAEFSISYPSSDIELLVDSVLVGSAMDAFLLTQGNVLSVAGFELSVAVDDLVLSQAGVLSVADIDVDLFVDSVVLLQANIISVAGVGLSIAADAVALTQANILSVADASVALLMGSVALSTADFLVVNELSLASAMDAVALVQANVLSVADMALQSSSDLIVLALNSVLSVADLSSAVALDSVVLDQSSALVVAGLELAVSAESPVLLQQNALSINDLRLSILMDSLTIGGGVFVTESALGMIVRDFQYVLLVEG